MRAVVALGVPDGRGMAMGGTECRIDLSGFLGAPEAQAAMASGRYHWCIEKTSLTIARDGRAVTRCNLCFFPRE